MSHYLDPVLMPAQLMPETAVRYGLEPWMTSAPYWNLKLVFMRVTTLSRRTRDLTYNGATRPFFKRYKALSYHAFRIPRRGTVRGRCHGRYVII